MRDGRITRTNNRQTRARVDCTDTQDSSATLLLSQPCRAMVLLHVAFIKRTTYKLERGHDEARRRRRYAAANAAAGLEDAPLSAVRRSRC